MSRSGQLIETFRKLIEYISQSAKVLVADKGERDLLDEQLCDATKLLNQHNEHAVCLVLLDLVNKIQARFGDDIDKVVEFIMAQYFGVLSKETADGFLAACSDDIKQFYDIMCLIAKSSE